MPLTAKQYFTLRRLHSLTGVVPVGLFLLEHWLTNTFAIFGPESYASKVEFLKSIPYLYAVELFGIAVPIALHAILGVWIGLQAKHNVASLPLKQNWMFLVQRISGLFLVVFILVHVWGTRFAHLHMPPLESGLPANAASNLHALMTDKIGGSPLYAIFYLLGTLSAAFHLGNGLWGFAIHWGFLTSRAAQRRWHAAALTIALVLGLAGVNFWLAFKPFGLSPVTFLNEPKHEAPAGGHAAAPAPSTETSSR